MRAAPDACFDLISWDLVGFTGNLVGEYDEIEWDLPLNLQQTMENHHV